MPAPYEFRKKYICGTENIFQYMWTDPGIPEYRFQAAFDGDYFLSVGLYDRSEKSYLRAISDPTLKEFSYQDWVDGQCSNMGPIAPNEPQRVIAYARLRLLELHVFLRKIDDAGTEAQYLAIHYQESTPGYRYSALAGIFWETYQTERDISDACAAVRKEAQQYQDELFSSFTYGYENRGPDADTICPFQSFNGSG